MEGAHKIEENHDHYHSSGGGGGWGGGYGGLGSGFLGGIVGGLLFGRGGLGGFGHGGGGREWAEDARFQGIQAQLADIKGTQREDHVLAEVEEVENKCDRILDKECDIEKEIASCCCEQRLAMRKLENHFNEKFCQTNAHIESVYARTKELFVEEQMRQKDAAIGKLKEDIEALKGKHALEEMTEKILWAVKKQCACTATTP